MSYQLEDQTPLQPSSIGDLTLAMPYKVATVLYKIKKICRPEVNATEPSAGSEQETSVPLYPMDGRRF
jgi:hypothetical protein